MTDQELAAIRDLAKSVETLATLQGERQAQAREDRDRAEREMADLRDDVRALRVEVDKVVAPVAEHYAAIRRARESEDAHGGRWAAFMATQVTPERALMAARWLLALAIAAGFGANFRGFGIGATMTTTADTVHESPEPTTPGETP